MVPGCNEMTVLVLVMKLITVVPAPRLMPPLVGMRVPKVSLQVPGSVVLTRNHAVVAEAVGLPEPLSCALLLVRFVAAAVVTTGTPGVVKESTAPNAVPVAFDVIAQKK